MASINNIKLFLEFEPIVKVVCDATDCQFNLWNASTSPDNQMRACNLKNISVGMHGQCFSFREVIKVVKKATGNET